jgi:hypothetical protein
LAFEYLVQKGMRKTAESYRISETQVNWLACLLRQLVEIEMTAYMARLTKLVTQSKSIVEVHQVACKEHHQDHHQDNPKPLHQGHLFRV